MVLHTQQSSSEHWPTLLSGRINGAFYSYTRFYVSNIKKSHIISQNKCDTQLLIMAARKNSHICDSIKYIHWTQQVCAINTCVDDWCHEDSWVTTSAGIGYDREVTGRVLSTQIFFLDTKNDQNQLLILYLCFTKKYVWTSPVLLFVWAEHALLGTSVGKLLSIREGTEIPELMHKHTHKMFDFMTDWICSFNILSVQTWITSLLQDYSEPGVPWIQTVSSSRQPHPALLLRRTQHRCDLSLLQPETRRWGREGAGGRKKEVQEGQGMFRLFRDDMFVVRQKEMTTDLEKTIQSHLVVIWLNCNSGSFQLKSVHNNV